LTRLHLLSAAIGAIVLTATPLSVQLSTTTSPSLKVDAANARVGRPLTPVSVAGVNRRHNRRAAYGYGAGVVGAGLGAAAIGTAAAVGAAPYYGGAGYYSGGPYASYSNGSYASSDGSYASYPAPVQNAPAFGTFCVPGTMVQMQDGQMHLCQ
jgi:hypothetical protein